MVRQGRLKMGGFKRSSEGCPVLFQNEFVGQFFCGFSAYVAAILRQEDADCNQ